MGIALAIAAATEQASVSLDDAAALLTLIGEQHPGNSVERLRRTKPVEPEKSQQQGSQPERTDRIVADGMISPETVTEDSQPSVAEVLESLKPSERKAWATWLMAERSHTVTPSDRKAYDWLKERDNDRFIGELVDYQMPAFATWQRQLRTARSAMGQQKNTPRAGRALGKSVARTSEI